MENNKKVSVAISTVKYIINEYSKKNNIQETSAWCQYGKQAIMNNRNSMLRGLKKWKKLL